MQLPSNSRLDTSAGGETAVAVLACVRSLWVASQHVSARLRDTGARARLGHLGDRCAEALEALERALEGAETAAPMGARRVPHGLRSVIEVDGVGADLCLLLELDVLAARLQARIDGLLAQGTPPTLCEPLRSLSALVRGIRAEYELYAA